MFCIIDSGVDVSHIYLFLNCEEGHKKVPINHM